MRLSRREMLRLGAGAAAFTTAGGLTSTAATTSRFNSLVADHPSTVASAWFKLALDLVQQTAGFTPPVAARALGYLGVTLYETLVEGMPNRDNLDGRLNGFSSPQIFWPRWINWQAAANAALARSLRHLFPTATSTNLARVDQLEDALLNALAAEAAIGTLLRSATIGRSVADHVYAWSQGDGGDAGYLDNFPTSYVPPVGPGLWIPTPPGFQPALQPYWANNRPFILDSPGQFDPGPHPPYSTNTNSAFYAEAWEVYQTVNDLTDEQRAIALFWADDPGVTSTPPGHSISLLNQVLDLLGSDLAEAAVAYLKVGIAVADAFISCWYSKFLYNLVRPISYIQALIDPSWGNPLPVSTPPFPEYTSGHSVQTGAFAQIAFHIFGDLAITDHTHDVLGYAPRSFSSWSELANETAISRLYGGIHFRSAIELGVEQGKALGTHVDNIIDGHQPAGRERWRR